MKEKIEQIEKLLGLSKDALNLDKELIDIPQWDSFAVLNFVTAFSTFTNPVALPDLRKCKNVEDLCKLIDI